MRGRAALAAVFGSLVLAAPASAVVLVTPQGQPVGGKMQRWADQSQVPTISGYVVLSPASICGAGVTSCSARPISGLRPELAATDREGLYFELGHLFDWYYLTWAQRKWLSHQWHRYGTPWTNSNLGFEQGTEDGLEGAFAAIYQSCAFNRHAYIAGIGLIAPPGATVVPASAEPRNGRSTCAFIERAIYAKLIA